MRESIEMYLLRRELLQENDQPVPLPRLAQELAVSPVSANEMCRKLTEKALVTYEPYKGVRLTKAGELMARRVLRHRRLWEVFFVDKLGLDPDQAEEIACRFEHVTPELLADQLALFLGHPALSPQNEPIPGGETVLAAPPTWALNQLAAGTQGQVVAVEAEASVTEFLRVQGLGRGAMVEVLAVTEAGAVLVTVAGQRLSLAAAVAGSIKIITEIRHTHGN
jgi:DtxR family Mn-dependent transcriptional regulator